jgi:Na+/proline symporter
MLTGFITGKNEAASINDFFLAEGSLTWWAIGASLIASNKSELFRRRH